MQTYNLVVVAAHFNLHLGMLALQSRAASRRVIRKIMTANMILGHSRGHGRGPYRVGCPWRRTSGGAADLLTSLDGQHTRLKLSISAISTARRMPSMQSPFTSCTSVEAGGAVACGPPGQSPLPLARPATRIKPNCPLGARGGYHSTKYCRKAIPMAAARVVVNCDIKWDRHISLSSLARGS